MKKEPVRIQLENGITAQVDWQDQMDKPFWSFGYIDDERDELGVGGSYQPCMCSGNEPFETLYKGIARYGLPLPVDPEHKGALAEWEQNEARRIYTKYYDI